MVDANLTMWDDEDMETGSEGWTDEYRAGWEAGQRDTPKQTPPLPDVKRIPGTNGDFRVEYRRYSFPLTSASYIRQGGLDRLAIAAFLDAETAVPHPKQPRPDRPSDLSRWTVSMAPTTWVSARTSQAAGRKKTVQGFSEGQ